MKGRHLLKFGVSLNHYQKTENAAGQQGTFTFTNAGAPTGLAAFFQEVTDLVSPARSIAQMPFGAPPQPLMVAA